VELLFILVGLVVLLLLLAAAGHALWLGLAGLWHLVFGRPTSVQPPAHWEDCPGCGEPVSPNRSRCAACGLLITSAKAARLRDLEAMQRQLTRFHDDGTLDAPTFERLRRDCQDARHSLLGTRRREPARPEEEIPVWRRLARLLERSSDGGDLTPDTRRQALAWYRETEPGRLAELSPAAQQTLARLLRRDGDRHGALRAYARLLKNRPEDASLAETAMEAAEAAAEGKRKEMARWFLKQALDRAPSPVLRQKAEELLRDLGPEEEILDVLPAEPETVPPTPQPPVISAPRRHRQNADEPPTPRRPAPPVEEPAAPVEEPGRPRRTLGEVLAAFMEERNILWGELVGGLLIVGCSVALVISLWERLEAIPYFPFLIFAGITAALFGAGLYTLHHWKLESTSRGLLVIALLLVPLNFVVLAGLSAEYSGDLLVVGTEVVTLAAFAGLVILAARVIVPERPRLLAFGMVGPAAGSLLVPRLLTYGQAELVPFLLLGCASVGCYFLACGAAIFQTRRRPPLQERSARDLLALLGLASFALAAALGFLVYRTGDLPVALQRLALPVALSGIPILAGGLLVYSPLAPVLRGEGRNCPLRDPAHGGQRRRLGGDGGDAGGRPAGLAGAGAADRRLCAEFRRADCGGCGRTPAGGPRRGASLPRDCLPNCVPPCRRSPGGAAVRAGTPTAAPGRVARQRQRPHSPRGGIRRRLRILRPTGTDHRRDVLHRHGRDAGAGEPGPGHPEWNV
jgi:hypothetical protein